MRLELDLPRSPSAPRIAREHVGRAFRDLVHGRALEDLKLVVSALVTNAIVHGAGAIGLTAQPIANGIRIEVSDAGMRTSPVISIQPRSPAGGFGLRLVDTLALSWGVRTANSYVWADMPVV